MDNEKVSVIMAVFNCEKTVSAAIDSIVNQTYDNWELIICDDCSSDGTLEIVNQYNNKYPKKIKVIRNEVNSKLPASLNHCLKYVTGTYVARMDGDDVSKSDRFEKQIKYLKSHPGIDLVGSYMDIFNGKEIIGVAKVPENIDKYHFSIYHATIMTYKYVYDKLNGYSLLKRAVRCEDLDLWFRFFAEGFSAANIQKSLYIVTDDENAKRRRNFKGRINATRTLLYGYHLLNYPIYRYPFAFNPIIKGLVPRFISDKLRNTKFK